MSAGTSKIASILVVNYFREGDDSFLAEECTSTSMMGNLIPADSRPDFDCLPSDTESEYKWISCGLFSIRFRAPHKNGKLSAAPVANPTDIVSEPLPIHSSLTNCPSTRAIISGRCFLASQVNNCSRPSSVLAIKYPSEKRILGATAPRGPLKRSAFPKIHLPPAVIKFLIATKTNFEFQCTAGGQPKRNHQMCINGINCYENIVPVPIDELCGRGALRD